MWSHGCYARTERGSLINWGVEKWDFGGEGTTVQASRQSQGNEDYELTEGWSTESEERENV